MKSYIYTIALIVNLLFSNVLFAQTSDPYNLDFDRPVYDMFGGTDNWQFLKSTYFTVNCDTACKIKGKGSLNFSLKERTGNKNGYGFFYQKLPIPSSTREVEMSFWTRGVFLKNTYFYCHVLNGDNETINLDSIKLPNSVEWKMSKLKLTLPSSANARILYFSFNSYNHSEGWVDSLDVRLDGMPYYQKIDSQTLSEQSTIPIFKDVDSLHPHNKDLQRLNSHSVIGIGESVHGSHELLLMRNKLIEHLVINENAKLVVLECNENFAETLNKFIHNESIGNDVTLESYFKSTQDIEWGKSTVHNYETIELVEFLRQYNDNNSQKVSLVGMDLPIWGIVRDSINRYSFNGDEARDKFMAEKVLQSIEKYCKPGEKTVIHGHLGHLMKLGGDVIHFNTLNTGRRLSENLGEKYFVIGLFAGNGSVLVNQSIFPTELKLQEPAHYSLEYFCDKINYNTLFFNTDSLINTETINSFRFVGGTIEKRQFHPFVNINRLFDAVAYSKESNCSEFVLLTHSPMLADSLIYFQEKNNKISKNIATVKELFQPLFKKKIKDGFYIEAKEGLGWINQDSNDTIYFEEKPYIDANQIIHFEFFNSNGENSVCIYFNDKGKKLQQEILPLTKLGIVFDEKLISVRLYTGSIDIDKIPSNMVINKMSIETIMSIEKKYRGKTFRRNIVL